MGPGLPTLFCFGLPHLGAVRTDYYFSCTRFSVSKGLHGIASALNILFPLSVRNARAAVERSSVLMAESAVIAFEVRLLFAQIPEPWRRNLLARLAAQMRRWNFDLVVGHELDMLSLEIHTYLLARTVAQREQVHKWTCVCLCGRRGAARGNGS